MEKTIFPDVWDTVAANSIRDQLNKREEDDLPHVHSIGHDSHSG